MARSDCDHRPTPLTPFGFISTLLRRVLCVRLRLRLLRVSVCLANPPPQTKVNIEADYLTSVVQQILTVQRNLFTAMEQLVPKLQNDYTKMFKVGWLVGWLAGWFVVLVLLVCLVFWSGS